ncbi:MAG: helix-turn-helix transcriptional regulator [Clostridia bacterium]|nr:helix-turn-helix transcriptional regulator [Clostridia bacterium]
MKLDTVKIGQFIRQGRLDIGLTQEEMGDRLGVTAQSVSNWERGESLPDISILPDLAQTLGCSADDILSGGRTLHPGQRRVTVAQMQEALRAVGRVGELLGKEHFIYRMMIDALNTGMNTDIEPAFTDPHIFDVFTVEMLLGCHQNGDLVDPVDVQAHLPSSKAREFLLKALEEEDK